MKHIIYIFTCCLLTSCFQCRDSYSINTKSENDLKLYIRGASAPDDVIRLNFLYSLPSDSCNLVIENTNFSFWDGTNIIRCEKKVAHLANGPKFYQELKDIENKYRTLSKPGCRIDDVNYFEMLVTFEDKYQGLEKFKMVVKTDTKDQCGNVKTYIDDFDVNIENHCHWHFLLH
jgi:hypothetical protein